MTQTQKDFKKFIEENDIQISLFERNALTTELILKTKLGNIPKLMFFETYTVSWKDWNEEKITPITIIKSDMNDPEFLDQLTKLLKEALKSYNTNHNQP